jgi:hypothetical protein
MDLRVLNDCKKVVFDIRNLSHTRHSAGRTLRLMSEALRLSKRQQRVSHNTYNTPDAGRGGRT